MRKRQLVVATLALSIAFLLQLATPAIGVECLANGQEYVCARSEGGIVDGGVEAYSSSDWPVALFGFSFSVSPSIPEGSIESEEACGGCFCKRGSVDPGGGYACVELQGYQRWLRVA